MEARIKVVPYEEAEGKLKDLYEAFNNEMANILRVHSLNPRSLEAHLKYYKVIMFAESPLSRRVREMIATVVSVENECFY
ncbi:carboxymuconolactone decarboxylase family protein [Alkalihalobacillus sp. CinArs1]|uniref:carboxymuconolactone decarboxylase family protein n=1 Tax=Alkalihalobacillus sp. CinArs1 TaxID=2995314 RepID=UPI0022DD4F98|nr:carboxymuconolactone decarboxylase family protein [Alkalihalobacillus sp. CinArs1]